jgi:hypothetical protein
MKASIVWMCALVLLTGFALQAADPAAATQVTGKVVALRDMEGKLSAVKLLGKDGRIYTVTLDSKGRELAAEAKQLVKVKGEILEEKAEGDKPAVYRLTVQEFALAESDSTARGAASRQP